MFSLYNDIGRGSFRLYCSNFDPMPPLTTYDEALRLLISLAKRPTETLELGLFEALGGVLATAIDAKIDVPSEAMSAMDGYAICVADVAADGETRLPVSQRIAAGSAAAPLVRGSVARIFTGAPIPLGADAVIMQEQVRAEEDYVRFDRNALSGNYIRPVGNDIKQGSRVLNLGCRLRPQEIGLAASLGLQTLAVFKSLRVGIFFTGDELVEPGQVLAPGKIYDSNRYTISSMLRTLGCDIVDLGLIGDTLEATRNAILKAAGQADLVVTSGGVSVGEEDHVRVAIEQLGQLKLWRLGVKPGKPLAFGEIDGTPFLGLPGNPVSVFATFCLFVVPVIKLMQGREWKKPTGFNLIADFDWPKPDSRREFLRARLSDQQGESVAQIFSNQDSAALTSTVWADGFVEIAEQQTVRKGEMVRYLPFTQFFD